MSQVGWIGRMPAGLHRRARRVLQARPGWVRAPHSDEGIRQEYLRNGFVCGGPLLNEAELVALRAELDRVAEQQPRVVLGDGAGGEIHKIYHPMKRSELFTAVLHKPRLLALLTLLTGASRVRVVADQIHDKPPKIGGWNGWHIDLPTFPLVPPYTAITAWIPLDDADLENGCMRMVPGSQAFDASDLAGDDWGLPTLPEEYCGHRIDVVVRPVRAGHVHFHHGRTWHASSPNRSGRKRRAFSIHYANAEDRYRAGGRIEFDGLSTGDSLDDVLPVVLSADRP